MNGTINVYTCSKVKKNELRHEKTNILHIRGYREADKCLCFRYIDSKIPLLSLSEISSLLPPSVAVQPGLCRAWVETRTLVFS